MPYRGLAENECRRPRGSTEGVTCRLRTWGRCSFTDQEDTSERDHKVSQLGSLYSQALIMVVWLEPETESSREAVSFLDARTRSLNVRRMKDLDIRAPKSLIGVSKA